MPLNLKKYDSKNSERRIYSLRAGGKEQSCICVASKKDRYDDIRPADMLDVEMNMHLDSRGDNQILLLRKADRWIIRISMQKP